MAQATLDTPRVTQAISRAQSSSNGNISVEDTRLLEEAIAEIWPCIQAQPDTYTMTPLEYRVFNYFQDRFRDEPVAIRARERYWKHHSIVDGLQQT